MDKLNKRKGYTYAIFIAVIIFILLITIEFFVFNAFKEAKKIELSKNYIAIQDRVNGVIDTNFNILRGFSAYVQTTENFNQADVYQFLDLLFEGTDTYIRNIGILEDTTIIWNYPPEKNQAAIGVDLSKVDGQRERVLKVKNEYAVLLDGPIDLIQGGIGYIIRMPLIRDNKYFGQISIVIDGDKFIQYLEDTQENFNVHFKILSDNTAIFNQEYDIQEDDLNFVISKDLFTWYIYLRPEEGWSPGSHWFIGIPFIFLVLSVLCALKFYNIYMDKKNNQYNTYHDTLTGLYNRHYLYKYAESIFNIAKINQYNIGVMVIDIDHFKQVNDNHGHVIGDEILINFSKKMTSELRKGQEIFRIGGDEFLIIFENLSDHHLLGNIMKRIKKSIEDYEIIPDSNIHITISAGVSMYPEDGLNLDILYNIADHNMYNDKS